MSKIKNFLRNYFKSIREIPPILLTLFVLTIVIMNILANKTIYQNDYIAIDGGIVITWLAIFIMDITAIVSGPKNAVKMSIFAVFINLIVCLIFYLVSLIPTSGDFEAWNKTLGGTWFIIISSTIAFICSSTLNAFLNFAIGKMFKKNPDGKLAYACRCYISTFVSQVLDNFTFNCLAFVVFAPLFWNGFHWTIVQCICCALLYGGIELVIEGCLFPVGYKLVKVWKEKKKNI